MIYNISTTLDLGVVSFLGATWDENDTSHENVYGTQQILKKFLMNEWINQLNISFFSRQVNLIKQNFHHHRSDTLWVWLHEE